MATAPSGLPWPEIAASAYRSFCHAQGVQDPEAFGDFSPQLRLAWQAVARHIADIDGRFGGELSPAELERRERAWGVWVVAAIARRENDG